MRLWKCSIPLTLLLLLGFVRVAPAQQEAPKRIQDVIYRKKQGVALTLDVFKPAEPSGIAVLFMVSGGWFSSHDSINPGMMKPFLDRKQTVFTIVHGSQPKYTIPEITEDIDRAVRFVRYHATQYGVDPARFGISGGSAGGHLSLWQGATGSQGSPDAKDPVDRVSSKVQAVACFFPPTDFVNYGQPGTNFLAQEKLKIFWPAFGAKSRESADLEAAGKAVSPLYRMTADMPPTLIIHGDADELVPIQQAELVMKRLEELKVPHRLEVRPGKGHGWANMGEDIGVLADWFNEHLGRR
jgi:acetyl esterase/lipase